MTTRHWSYKFLRVSAPHFMNALESPLLDSVLGNATSAQCRCNKRFRGIKQRSHHREDTHEREQHSN